MADQNPLGATQSFEPDSDESPADALQNTGDAEPGKHPLRIARYRIEKVLGKGGFGIVYLAHDEQLNRLVAVKVPHASLISKPEDADAYLAEARTVANLDHPAIVPVHDVGNTDDCPCYIVSKYIPGTDLATKLKQRRLKYSDSAELIATVAEALHYAHKHGIVHRDIKPGNILIDKDGKPYVVDFGLALREENAGKGPKNAGTPAYMSPEQARGEGHRVDGRSDIFSLGVVFYELLAGRQPFRGDTQAELMEQVTSYEPRPLRQFDEKLPKELERISQKSMAKRASERYSSAFEMAEDLRHFLAEQSVIQSGTSPGGMAAVAAETHTPKSASTSVGSVAASSAAMNLGSSDNQPIKIVPKGLRSFDSHDADFFLELLPGPRDRDRLPDSLRFWKTRIEENDPDNTFSVGLICGPSGCGKSSLVKAGLLPRLSEDVISVYIEATPEETETRLLHGLKKRCPALDDTLSLKDTLTALRRGHGIPDGKKVLIVLDQFEQWLHAKKEQENTDLVQALRQCEGSRIQCIVMVRDDFWMAVIRFMRELEVRLVEGQNSAAVDLFQIPHAEKVLAAFGRALGTLPDNLSELNKQQQDFIQQSTSALAEEGKVICVRLALFADMMKGKAWIPSTLKEVGGTKGVGVTFLEETFSSSTSPPEHRYHQKAAQAVLRDLLPESGTDIKGYMRSYTELLEASGYRNRPKDFDDLVRILDSEIRLISPTDPEGRELSEDSVTQTKVGQKYFQLTHDYLVHSLRDWLTRKQRETREGRAELKLAERASAWNSAHDRKQLPTMWEWLSISTLTDKKHWTDPQQAMMRLATNLHGLRSGLATLGLITIATIGWIARDEIVRQQEVTRIQGLVGQLVSADPNKVGDIIKKLDSNKKVATTHLSSYLSSKPTTLDEKRSQLHARLAMVSNDSSLRDQLVDELLNNKVVYVGPIRQQLRPWAKELTEEFRDILRDEKGATQRRFRSALALADYVPESENKWWTKQDLKFVAEQLVASNAEFQLQLREYLRPISAQLLGELEKIFADPKGTDGLRLSAANAFADYAAGDIAKLSQLLVVANLEQFSVLYPLVSASPLQTTVEGLSKIAATLPESELGSAERVVFGQRRANAAVTLLRLGEREKVLPVFEMTDDPEAQTQFIFGSRPRGIGVDALLDMLQLIVESRGGNIVPTRSVSEENSRNVSARYALLLALGEFALNEIPESRREPLFKQLSNSYRNNPSSGVHGAAGWLLRQWGQTEVVREVDQTPLPYSLDREWFTLAIPGGDQTFFQTYVVIPPGDYQIGSPGNEPGRRANETRHTVQISRPFALLDREVTRAEFEASAVAIIDDIVQYSPSLQHPMVEPSWYDSVRYCRWLTAQAGLSNDEQCYADPQSLDSNIFAADTIPAALGAPRNWPLRLEKRGFRLPTEAEWEIAARSGTRTTYGFGGDDSLLNRYTRFHANSVRQTHLPRTLRPNLAGLFDLHGNMFEWCHDWSGSYGSSSNPPGAATGSLRVIRGGGWNDDAALCRSANRGSLEPTRRVPALGFRLALSPSIESAAK